jgi:hypothetical protein
MSTLRVNQISARTGTGNVQVTGGKIVSPGSVLQVVSTTFTGIWSAGGSSTTFYTVSDLNTNITPVSATSKILISATLNIGSSYWEIQGRFLRGGTAIGLGTQRGARSACTFLDNRYEAASSVRNSWGAVSAQFLDSPATTAPVTYGVALNGYSSSTVGVNYNPYTDPNDPDYFGCPISTLTLTEIAQ